MSDFINPLLGQIEKEAAKMRRQAAKEERERMEAEEDALEYEYETELAKRKAIALRKTTLDMAWAAAELLHQAQVTPNYWLYTRRPQGLFRRKAVQGIGATGWPLVAWRSTRYAPRTAHRLILTPTSEGNSGVHLSFFEERQPHSDEPAFELLPHQLHPLPAEPTSQADMPWPKKWDEDNTDNGIMSTDEVDHEFEIQRAITRMRMDTGQTKHSNRRGGIEKPWVYVGASGDHNNESQREIMGLRMALVDQQASATGPSTSLHAYELYFRSRTEEAIRRSIAAVAALHLHIAPEKAAQTLARRIELGIEEQPE